MIIKKFEELVETFREKTAIKDQDSSLTYGQLNRWANRIARAVSRAGESSTQPDKQIVALLFQHNPHIVAGMIGVLKAGKAYVPLDVNHPGGRLVYMLNNSESYLLLTDSTNRSRAETLVNAMDIPASILEIDTLDNRLPETNPNRDPSGAAPAYILYTSGSTGRPKGIVQNHQNVLYYTQQWTKRFDITHADNMTLITSFCHDGAVQDIWSALLNGAALFAWDIRYQVTLTELPGLLVNEKITLWHSVPTLFRHFTEELTGKETFPHLRHIILGGEKLREYDITMAKEYFPTATLANVYGQTEVSVCSCWLLPPGQPFVKVVIGEPLENMKVMLVDDDGDVVEELGVGEVAVACDHLADGYWKDEEKTRTMFTHAPGIGKIYWTGDLGRLNSDGSIELLGRKDFQLKIRGYRVELGEIETVLLNHPAVNGAAVIAKEDANKENFLAAFITLEKECDGTALRAYAAEELPDYMIPAHFVTLRDMPLTPNGKIDRKELEAIEITITGEITPPEGETEQTLARIWAELLYRSLESIGRESNFFDLGAHSLKANILSAKVHKIMGAKISIIEVFRYPTLTAMAHFIEGKQKEDFFSIQPAEKKEYYPLSAAQKRYYVLQQMNTRDTTYNIVLVNEITGRLDKDKFDRVFKKLIHLHESLRTTFEIVSGEPVQIIHPSAQFTFEYHETQYQNIDAVVKTFVKSHDLKKAPLCRAGFIKVEEERYILMVDMHHIISDGYSLALFVKEFLQLYDDGILAGNHIQYKDYSTWQQKLLRSNQIQKQRDFWLNIFKGPLPQLNMPSDFPKSAAPADRFQGDKVYVIIDKKLTAGMKQLAFETESTLNIVLLSAYNILLHKYTGRDDIIVGSLTTGRGHVDLENIIGLFINTLALRNFPSQSKTVEEFLKEVKTNSLNAFENQDYQFNDLVSNLGIKREAGKYPLFDTMFTMQNITSPQGQLEGLDVKTYNYRRKATKFDFYFDAVEFKDTIGIDMKYSTHLYKRATIEKFVDHLLQVLQQMVERKENFIKEINISLDAVDITSTEFLEDQGDFGI